MENIHIYVYLYVGIFVFSILLTIITILILKPKKIDLKKVEIINEPTQQELEKVKFQKLSTPDNEKVVDDYFLEKLKKENEQLKKEVKHLESANRNLRKKLESLEQTAVFPVLSDTQLQIKKDIKVLSFLPSERLIRELEYLYQIKNFKCWNYIEYNQKRKQYEKDTWYKTSEEKELILNVLYKLFQNTLNSGENLQHNSYKYLSDDHKSIFEQEQIIDMGRKMYETRT